MADAGKVNARARWLLVVSETTPQPTSHITWNQ